jgi:hypothetical protein
MDQLTIDHPRWQEFIVRLEQRLDFRERSDEPGNYQWLCGKDEDPFAYTREVLTAMGFRPEASLATIRSHGAVAHDRRWWHDTSRSDKRGRGRAAIAAEARGALPDGVPPHRPRA